MQEGISITKRPLQETEKEEQYAFPVFISREKKNTITNLFIRHGVISGPEDEFVDKDKLLTLLAPRDFVNSISVNQMLTYLADKKVKMESKDESGPEMMLPAVAFPKSKDELLCGESEGAIDFSDVMILNSNGLLTQIKLEDGTVTTPTEIKFLRTLKELYPLRYGTGELTIVHPETRKRVPFSFKLFPKYFKDSGFSQLGIKSADFVLDNYLPNVSNMGLIKHTDVPSMGGTERGDKYGSKERSFKTRNTPYFTFTNDGITLYYYLGRNKIVGTDIEIDKGTMRLIQLDTDTVGIIEKGRLGSKILATLDLLGKEEAQNFRMKVKERLEKKYPEEEVTESKISMFSHLPADEVEKLIHTYNSEDIFPEYVKRSSMYSEIKDRADDPVFVVDTFRNFVKDADISPMKLSWAEQVVTATVVRKLFSEQSVISFLKKHKENGLKTFLSVLQSGLEMGDKILTLGDEAVFPPQLTKKLFNKYSTFVESANNIQHEISHLLGDKRTLNTSKISEKLLVRAKNLLVEYADKAQQGEVDEQKIDEDLDHIHQEIAVLGYAYIEMARQGDYADLEDLGKVNVAVRSSSEYSEKEKEELEKVYEYSRPKETFENPEHIQLLRKEFRESLDREDVTVFEVDLDNKKIAFALLYYKDPKTLHMGGLSFHPDARNPAVGLAVMESMAKNLGNYAIEAEVHSENKILAMYTNRFGFTIVGEEPREKNAGELYYIIRREPTADKTAPIE